MKILSIDCGVVNYGYSIIECTELNDLTISNKEEFNNLLLSDNITICEEDCLSLNNGEGNNKVLSNLKQLLTNIVEKFEPEMIIIERQFMNKDNIGVEYATTLFFVNGYVVNKKYINTYVYIISSRKKAKFYFKESLKFNKEKKELCGKKHSITNYKYYCDKKNISICNEKKISHVSDSVIQVFIFLEIILLNLDKKLKNDVFNFLSNRV